MHTRRDFGLQLAALSALLSARAMSVKAAERVLRFAAILGAESPHYVNLMEPFARSIERDSGGRLDVALKPAGGYGKPTELLPLMERGEIEMAVVPPGYYPARFVQSTVIELPLIFADSSAGTRALTTLYQEGLLAKDYEGSKVLALYMAPPYALFTTGKKIASLSDLRGLRIRVSGPMVGMALARLGAIPIGMPSSRMGDAIANGTIDAMTYSMDSTLGTKGAGGKYLFEQMSVVADLRFGSPAQVVAMNKATWDALPPDLQRIVEQCSASFVKDGTRYREDAEVAAARKLQADPRYTFLPFSSQLYEEMQRVTVPVYENWKADMSRRGVDGERLLARTRELVKQFSATSARES